jgi:hypothetical protein
MHQAALEKAATLCAQADDGRGTPLWLTATPFVILGIKTTKTLQLLQLQQPATPRAFDLATTIEEDWDAGK